MSRAFSNGPENRGSIPGRVIPKTPKMVLDAAFLNTQRCKLRIKGKVEQSKEWSSALPYTSVYKLLKTKVANFIWIKKKDLVLNNQQMLICHKTWPTNISVCVCMCLCLYHVYVYEYAIKPKQPKFLCVCVCVCAGVYFMYVWIKMP